MEKMIPYFPIKLLRTSCFFIWHKYGNYRCQMANDLAIDLVPHKRTKMKTKLIYLFLTLPVLVLCTITMAQMPLKTGSAGGPSGNGPSVTSQTVTLYTNGTTAFSPSVTASFSFSSQQYPAGTLEGIASKPAMNFGGNINNSSNNSMAAQAYYPHLAAVSSPLSTMFSACSNCGSSGINVNTDNGISIFNSTEAFINASTGANTKALNARVYMGYLTITFNRPLSNPVLHFTGLGGTTSVTKTGKNYDLGFSTEFELADTGITMSKLAGNAYLSVINNSISNTASWFGANSQGSSINGVIRYAASGSVMASGTNITSLSFKVYLHGDGGRISNSSGSVVSPAPGLNPLWAFGANNAFGASGNVTGDLLLLGISVLKPVNITGTVFNDPDGNFVNNSTGAANVVPAGIYASLIDNAGKMVSQVPVNTNGTFSFPATFEGSYTINLSVTAGTQGTTAPVASLPSGWVATGEYNGTPNTGNDGNANSTSVLFAVNNNDITNVNFGIERPPLAPAQVYTIPSPVYNTTFALNGTGTLASPGPIRGNDPEEGYLVSGKNFSITTGTGMNGNKLFYNGIEITGTVSISNYNPALLTVKFCGAGSVELMFTYQSYDAAGKVSNSALYKIGWLYLLPARLFETTAVLNGDDAVINWKTSGELSTSHFYTERSTDNSNFITIALTTASGNSATEKNYSITDDISAVNSTVIYYRNKLVDANGKITYSNTVAVRKSAIDAVSVFPNPFMETVNVSFYSTVCTTAEMRITDLSGKILAAKQYNVVKGNNQASISNLKNIPAGIYLLQVKNKNGSMNLVQKIMK